MSNVWIMHKHRLTQEHEETELCNLSVFAEALREAAGTSSTRVFMESSLFTQHYSKSRSLEREKCISFLNEIFPILRLWLNRKHKYSVLPRTLCSIMPPKNKTKKSLNINMTVVLHNLKLVLENKSTLLIHPMVK